MKACILILFFSILFAACQIKELKNKPDDLSLAKWEVYKGLYNFIDRREYARCRNRKNNHFFMAEQNHRCPDLIPQEIHIEDYLASELILETLINKGDTAVFHFSLMHNGKCIVPLCPIDAPNAAGVYQHTVVYLGFDSAIFSDKFDDHSFISYVLKDRNSVSDFLFEEAQKRYSHLLKTPKPDRNVP